MPSSFSFLRSKYPVVRSHMEPPEWMVINQDKGRDHKFPVNVASRERGVVKDEKPRAYNKTPRNDTIKTCAQKIDGVCFEFASTADALRYLGKNPKMDSNIRRVLKSGKTWNFKDGSSIWRIAEEAMSLDNYIYDQAANDWENPEEFEDGDDNEEMEEENNEPANRPGSDGTRIARSINQKS